MRDVFCVDSAAVRKDLESLRGTQAWADSLTFGADSLTVVLQHDIFLLKEGARNCHGSLDLVRPHPAGTPATPDNSSTSSIGQALL